MVLTRKQFLRSVKRAKQIARLRVKLSKKLKKTRPNTTALIKTMPALPNLPELVRGKEIFLSCDGNVKVKDTSFINTYVEISDTQTYCKVLNWMYKQL